MIRSTKIIIIIIMIIIIITIIMTINIFIINTIILHSKHDLCLYYFYGIISLSCFCTLWCYFIS